MLVIPGKVGKSHQRKIVVGSWEAS